MFEHAIWSRTDDHQPCQCPGKRIMIGSSPSRRYIQSECNLQRTAELLTCWRDALELMVSMGCLDS